MITDTEAFRRPMGGYFRDRFARLLTPGERLNVLFCSPYPICPPIHGGGVFMYQTALELTRLCDLHLLILLDNAWESEPHAELEQKASSVEYLVRTEGLEKQFGAILPHAVREFASPEFEWRLHREMYLREIDVVQLEYTTLSQYGGDYQRLACMVFEHDIYFQSIARGLAGVRGLMNAVKPSYEYLRALRYELRVLPKFDRVQVCSPENGRLPAVLLARLRGRIDDNRAGIATARYEFRAADASRKRCCLWGAFAILRIRKGSPGSRRRCCRPCSNARRTRAWLL